MQGKPHNRLCGMHILSLLLFALALNSCLGKPVLQHQVLGYDEVTRSLEEKLLLMNIARVDSVETIHFTSTSSIAATFDWTTTLGAGAQISENPGFDFFNFNFNTSVSENPTFSIIPLSGQEFTKRIMTPFKDNVFESLVFQNGTVNQLMRLVAAGIEVQTPEGHFARFIENSPRRAQEYEEFRRIAAHLQWLLNNRQLFVRSLVFKETMVADFKGVPTAEDIAKGMVKGLKWRQKPDGNYELTRLQGGRVMISNFDPVALTEEERFLINEKIKKTPPGHVYLHIRPDGPGGDFPIQGAIKLRSLFQILWFLADGIRAEKEFDVAPDPRTLGATESPTSTLKINITDSAPGKDLPSINYKGRYYSVNDTYWDRDQFFTLNILFQTAVGDVEAVGFPITIAK